MRAYWHWKIVTSSALQFHAELQQFSIKKFPGSRHKFAGKREISNPKLLGKFPVPTYREETLLETLLATPKQAC